MSNIDIVISLSTSETVRRGILQLQSERITNLLGLNYRQNFPQLSGYSVIIPQWITSTTIFGWKSLHKSVISNNKNLFIIFKVHVDQDDWKLGNRFYKPYPYIASSKYRGAV